MSILVWTVFGMLAGIVAYLFDPKESQGGIIGAVVVGIMGSLLGGLLASLIFQTGLGNLNLLTVVIAIIGSVSLLVAEKAFSRRT